MFIVHQYQMQQNVFCPSPSTQSCILPQIYKSEECSCGCPSITPNATECIPPQIYVSEECSCGCPSIPNATECISINTKCNRMYFTTNICIRRMFMWLSINTKCNRMY
eukprot:541583_1